MPDIVKGHLNNFLFCICSLKDIHDSFVIQTAEKGRQTFRNILTLREQINDKIITLGRKAVNARKLISCLYQKPVLTGSAIAKKINVTPHAANALINDLERLEILKEQTGFNRNRIYAFEEYLRLFRG
jgi:Fic family protein